jgi:outer membrane lipoprotein-sorting protein
MQIARESCHFFRILAIRSLSILVGAMLVAPVPQPAAAAAEPESVVDPVAQEILLHADRIRFPKESFQVDVGIVTRRADQSTETRRYQVLSKGNDRTLVITTEPASERGQTLLMNDRNLWVFLPNVSQPVRLSLAQRLTGQVANGDLARANFTGDYHPRILRSEIIDGEPHHVLELTGVDRSVTYPRVLFWVKQKNFHPHKAEFYSLSNRLLKTCRYENFRTMAGRLRPTRLVMDDALRAGEQSILEYDDMKLRELPDKLFTKEYLRRLD